MTNLPVDEPGGPPNHMDFSIGGSSSTPSASAPQAAGTPTGGWLMTAVAPWGESEEDAFDQCLVDLGLGDCRLVQVKGAMLPMGFTAEQPRPLPMGSLVECHFSVAYSWNGGTACAGAAWARCNTPEGEEVAIVATIATEEDYEETEILLKRQMQRRLASRDLEIIEHGIAVDEITAAEGHWGGVIAALILPDSLGIGGPVGRVRESTSSTGLRTAGDGGGNFSL
ncbi:MAG: hypothetical protein DBX05_05535 [Candidatus Poseidoniales archaeon]|nr:MAG: hypothetical protein CBE15_00405 [Euryarchaeota archaeon TMED255]RCH73293.1 MAG: hypothetical protein DBX05_05535 [Candidatus Poseidoniales archaeon]